VVGWSTKSTTSTVSTLGFVDRKGWWTGNWGSLWSGAVDGGINFRAFLGVRCPWLLVGLLQSLFEEVDKEGLIAGVFGFGDELFVGGDDGIEGQGDGVEVLGLIGLPFLAGIGVVGV
jgi:hypothetical protein